MLWCVSGRSENFPGQQKGLAFLELEQPEWLEKLHFMVDMTVHLNTLHTALQGKGHAALHMLEEVLSAS